MIEKQVSTHSRPKAAGKYTNHHMMPDGVSTHSRPKAAGYFIYVGGAEMKSFNSQPPEGGWVWPTSPVSDGYRFQLTAARRRLAGGVRHVAGGGAFQLTAARRRLVVNIGIKLVIFIVSTHSRAKAAGLWRDVRWRYLLFQLTAARRRLEGGGDSYVAFKAFQLTAARRRLG